MLCVVAHPDDEIAFAGVLYKTASHLDGRCDVLVITNGEGGFKYSTLSEEYYGTRLTEEAVGRARLPRIRSRELLAGCRILGVCNVFLLGEQDHRFTRDQEEILDADADIWDLDATRAHLRSILEKGAYDFVLTLAPTAETHGHHKAATILALEAVNELPEGERPAVLCARSGQAGEPAPQFSALDGYAMTGPRPGTSFVFDRTQSFGHRGRLNYKIVVNWAIAEHKSQGTMQLLMNRGDREHYFLFDSSPAGAEREVGVWFERLREPQFGSAASP